MSQGPKSIEESPIDSRQSISENSLSRTPENLRMAGLNLYLDDRPRLEASPVSMRQVLDFRNGRLPERAGYRQTIKVEKSTRSPESKDSDMGRTELPSIRQKYFSFAVPGLPRSSGETQLAEQDYQLLYLQAQEQLAAASLERDAFQAERKAVWEKLEQIIINSVEPENGTEEATAPTLLDTANQVSALVRLLLLRRAGRRENIFRSQLEELLSQEAVASGLPEKDPAEEEKVFVETLMQIKPKWKERSNLGQTPVEFLEQHYGEFLVRFGASRNRLFQDQLKKIDRPLFVAITNYLADRFSAIGLRPRDFIPPKTERVSARIEQGYADPRTTAARQQREHRRKLRQKESKPEPASS